MEEKRSLMRDRHFLWRFSKLFTISGDTGVGTSTTVELLYQILKEDRRMRFVSAGDIMRREAKERGISIDDFVKMKEDGLSCDERIDAETEKYGTQNFGMIESRIAHGLVPAAFHIKLKCPTNIRAERRRLTPAFSHLSLVEVEKYIIERDEADKARFDSLYTGYDWVDSDFDLVISTDNLNIPIQNARLILDEHEKWLKKLSTKGIRIKRNIC